MSLVSDLYERLRALFFRAREDREMHEELQFHVDMETERNRRSGMNTGEARRQGHLALGGVDQISEEVRDARGTRLLEDMKADVAYTARTLIRSPGFAIVAILTLAIGIGGSTAVYSAVDAVLIQPLPYQDPGQLVRLYMAYDYHNSDYHAWVTPVHFLDYRSRMSSFESTAALLTYSETGADIGRGDAGRRIRLLPVSADYFTVLRVPPALGRPFDRAAEDGPGAVADIGIGARSVVLSQSLWRQEFNGDPGAIGRTLVMNGEPFVVAGVMPAGFVDPIAGTIDAWIPMDLRAGKDVSNANNHYLTVIARLRPGLPIERAEAELDLLGTELAKQYPNAANSRARLYPLKEDVVGTSSRVLELMLGAVALVLILVCVNVANLLLVRASERTQEFALRSALGAERARLIRQLLIESLTLAIAGGAAGLVVARLGMSAIIVLGGGSIPRLSALHLEPRLLVFSFALSTLCAVGFGLAPALRAAQTEPGESLREQSRSATGGGARMRTREWLVAAQVALAFVLLVGTGLLVASIQRLRQVDLGFEPAAALAFELHLPDARYDSTARARFYDAFADQAGTLRGVTAVGGISKLPATGPYHQWGTQALTGPYANDERKGNVAAEQRIVSGRYFQAVNIPLLDGRLFDATDDARAPDRALVSKSLAEALFPGVRAVGQRLNTGGRVSEIIGVVGDVAVNAEGDPDQYVYHWHAQWAGDRNWALVQILRTSGSLDAAQADARALLTSMDPQLVMWKPMPLSDAVGQGEAQRTFTLRVLGCFAIVALALSALGLFGVLSYGVRLRTREFGIRMALGAQPGAIRRMVMRQGLTMTAIGTVAGLLGAVALSRIMVALVFKVSTFDPRVLGGAMLFMGCVAAIAAYLPARRATRVDPRTALQ
ncbi:MAG: ABC transporter permease [Gemmatimonadota bacterium]